MRSRERVLKMNKGEKIDRVPFMPTLYEHCAALINKTPSEVAQDKSLFIEAQLKGYEVYQHDLVTVGMDIYNVEVEALGAKIAYSQSIDVPGISFHPLAEVEDLTGLKLPNPEQDGRMPMFLEAAAEINKQIGDEVIVNGTIVGPFTLAALLRGFEKFIMDIMMNPDYARQLLNFCADVGVRYGEAMIKRGVGLSINESWISPPLMSPKIFKDEVLPWEKYLISELKAKGIANIGLISGGNTTAIVDDMIQAGSSLIMADYGCDLGYFKQKADQAGITLRGCIDSKMLEKASVEEINSATEQVLQVGVKGGKFVIGCGVVSYNTPTEKLLAFKNSVEQFCQKQ
ncbi:MAG: uroporphyrinogen decarboxylase family protein [Bacillota bacterium]|nr:uroporphyrinogen decarboxylase family protein [Bacillota bacterium]